MKKLYLYALFHANLSFSSVPQKKYPTIVDSCYWPLLDLIKQGHKVGFEFPSSTLRIVQKIDRSFIRELASVWKNGQCEVVGSGFNQNIFPLIPYEVNKANLERGMRDYEDILGKRPHLAFINEQTYSGGLPSLYREAGFQAIMMDWDNASEYHRYPPELRYRPVLVEGVDGTCMPTIWNSSLNSYKFQRCVYDRMTIEEYINEVMVHFPFGEDRSLVLYGTDVEMFNYRPITQEQMHGEIRKIGQIFSLLKEKKGIAFVNPSDILNYFATFDKIKIESPECPLPCKNRDDYNVLRWAVSGRDDVWFNTECYKVYNKIQNVHFLEGESDLSKHWDSLNLLWSSDLRTKTTNEKHYEGRKKIGEISNNLDRQLEYLFGKIEIEKDFVLFNPHNEVWENEPYQMEFHFLEGQLRKKPRVKINDAFIPSQCEQVTYYRDGSIRTVSLVCLPHLGPYDFVQGELVPDDGEEKSHETVRFNGKMIHVETAAVSLELAQSTGGDIRALTFPAIFGSPLIGYLSPVYFDHVGHSNDYYSMGLHVIDSDRGVVNDTRPTQIVLDGERGQFPIRIPIVCKVALDVGIVWKRYFIYQNSPRVDLDYTFYLDNLSPQAFRLGIMTINPQSFSKNYLKISTTNGSPHIEQFYVDGRRIHHHHPVGTFSSGQCCLGATEGWVDVSDQHKGIAMISDKSQLYSVPMCEYEEIKKSYLMRVYNSISESDETGKIFWRGHNTISFTLFGHRNNVNQVRKRASHINKKLICLYKHGEQQFHADTKHAVMSNLVKK
jgi:hypothetical protein